jgi:uncharacterized protein (TIGR03435 family)
MRAILGIGWIAFACAMGHAQSANQTPTFDAVSVKVAPPPDGRGYQVAFFGGPGTKTPDRINVENYGMAALVSRAYGVEYYQVFGPDWLTAFNSERYNIVGTVAPGTTEARFRLMMQNLLADRFKLTLHKETREMAIYSLTVAKNGPKLKKAAPDPPPDPNAAADDGDSQPGPLKKDEDGYPILSRGTTMAAMRDHARMANKGHMQVLVNFLAGQIGQPVVDVTGLTDEYEFSLSWVASRPSATEDSAGPDLFAALQQQLGLKLESKKGPIEVLVVDHAERIPTAN